MRNETFQTTNTPVHANFNSVEYIQIANAVASISCEDSIATLRAPVSPTLRTSVSASLAEAFPHAAVSQAAHQTDVSIYCTNHAPG